MLTAAERANDRQGTVPDHELQALLAAVAGGVPWRQALESLQLPSLSRKRRWFTDTDKARFYLGLPTAARGRALDVGAGSGNLSHGLAAHFRRVVALEHHPGWCEFMRGRFAQDNVGNVDVIHAGALPLPFEPETFDLVVVNGVLEWLPEAAPEQRPRDVQLGFLRDVHRVLRPGGAVGIAIENRLFLESFLGYSPHGEPRFAAILPRRVADWYARRVTGRKYRNWIYGYFGYRRLLAAAGFAGATVQAVLPDYGAPRDVISVRAARAALPHFLPARPVRKAVLRTLTALGLLGYMVHSFYISARK